MISIVLTGLAQGASFGLGVLATLGIGGGLAYLLVRVLAR